MLSDKLQLVDRLAERQSKDGESHFGHNDKLKAYRTL